MSQHRTTVGAITSIESVQIDQRAPSLPKANDHVRAESHISLACASGNEHCIPSTGQSLQSTNSKRMRLSVQGSKRITPSSITSSANGGNGAADDGPSEYTQRVLAASTPTASLNPLLSLSHPQYGLPSKLIGNLADMGIRSIYPWQSSCLLGHGLLSGDKNLIYSAPTGGGKSLVADILMINRVIDNPGKKAILVLPYVALVQEKSAWLRKAVNGVSKKIPDEGIGQNDYSTMKRARRKEESQLRVVGFFGGSKARATWFDVDIAVCTIEKVGAFSLLLLSVSHCLREP